VHEKQFTWPYVEKRMVDYLSDLLCAKETEPEFKGFGKPVKVN